MRLKKILSATAAVGIAGALALSASATAHAATAPHEPAVKSSAAAQANRVVGPLASNEGIGSDTWRSWAAPTTIGSRVIAITTKQSSAPTDGGRYTLPAPGTAAGPISPEDRPDLCLTVPNSTGYSWATMQTCNSNDLGQQFTVGTDGRITSSFSPHTLQSLANGGSDPSYYLAVAFDVGSSFDDFFDLTQFKPVASEAAAVAVTGPAAGSTVTTKRPTVTGTGEPGATVTVTTQSGKNLGTVIVKTDGTWTLTPTSDIAAKTPTLTATQNADGTTTTTTVTFTITTPASDLSAAITVPTDVTRQATIGGAGQNGATVTVSTGGVVLGTATVVGGSWSIDVPSSIGAGSHTFAITQTSAGKPAGTATVTHDFGGAVTATNRITGSTVIISGTGVNGARVSASENGAQVGTATVSNGVYSINVPNVSTGAHTYTVNQTAPGNIVSTAMTTVMRASAITVTNPANAAAGYTPNTAFTFRGTAPKTAGTLTIRNFTGLLIATVPVDPATGAWSWTRSNMGTSTWKLTFATGEGTASAETYTLPDFAPNAAPTIDLKVLNPADPAAGYAPNTAFTFSGVAKKTAGTVTIRNFTGLQIAKVPVNPTTGAWSWTRSNMGTSTWRLTFTTEEGTSSQQKVTLGDFAPRS